MSVKIPASVEREFFRRLNSVVEPAVRFGVASPRFAPAGLIVLETIGFKSGLERRTPLVAVRFGDHVIAGTVRGERSFWVKNLRKRSRVRFWRGGKERQARAFVMAPGKHYRRPERLSGLMGRVTDSLTALTDEGWAFVVLSPLELKKAA
ncbi:MAG: nitroreductase/quinone reductase family protein [Halieaceae bacterium]